MRLFTASFALDPFLLLWLFATISNIEASPPQNLNLPLQTPPTYGNAQNRSWFTRVRNGLIETIWPVSSSSTPNVAGASIPQPSNPTPRLLSRYGGDLVLRFRITSFTEGEALADAIKILFLDVWEFNSDWVDIRLAKDVVGHASSPTLLKTLTRGLFRFHHC